MGSRPRDTFWNYAHPESDKHFKCNFCDKVFAGGISRIKSHLSGIKGRDIDICLKVHDDIRDEARQAIDDSLPCKKKGKKTIESPPCKKKGKRIISPDEQILEYERGVKESWRETGFTLVIVHDIYIVNFKYGNMFAYCPKGMLLLTSGNFSSAFQDLAGFIAEFCARLCLQAIAPDDFTDAFDLAVEIKNNCHGVLLSLSPINIIHSLVQDYVSDDNNFGLLLDAVEIIFTYMWKFSLVWRRKIFNEWKKHEELACTYSALDSDRLMLLRPVIEHEDEVESTVRSIQSMDISKWIADVTTIKFWTMGKELIHIIDILSPLARLVEGRVPAFGYLYEAVNKARDALDECYNKDPIRYSKLKSWRWDERLREMIKPIHAAACLLNPAIMCGENFKEESQMITGTYELMENFFVDLADKDLFLSQVVLYRAKSPSIFTDTANRKSKTLHPWVWWREFGGRVPELQKCAIQILSQPCDVPLWIQDLPAAIDASDRRELKLSLMEKFSGSEASSLEPIDLETAVESCEYEKQEYFDDLSTSSNPSATLGLYFQFLDPEGDRFFFI